MTTDTMTQQPMATPDAEKPALVAEGAKRGLKFDMRWGVQRMKDAIAEHDARGVAPQPATAAKPPETNAEREAAVDATAAKMAAMEKELEQLRAERAATEAASTAADKAAKGSNAPRGMLTSMDLGLTDSPSHQEQERKILMDKCAQVGIAHKIPPRANNDSIRDILGRHMAEVAQQMASKDAASRLKAKGPQEQFVAMRVLPLGHQKISKGIHVPGFGDECFEKGDIIDRVPLATARMHEANGVGEIIGEPVAA